MNGFLETLWGKKKGKKIELNFESKKANRIKKGERQHVRQPRKSRGEERKKRPETAGGDSSSLNVCVKCERNLSNRR